MRRPSPPCKPYPAPRLLGGTRRGFSLRTGHGEGTRPTAVRARKALFDALAHRASLHTDLTTEEGSVWLLDAFAGSGALGLEALSRWQEDNQGCGVFFEKDTATAQALRDNIERSGLKGRVLCADALTPMPARAFNERGESGPRKIKLEIKLEIKLAIKLAFFDPPYAMSAAKAVRAPAAFAEQGWFSEGALVVFQRATTQEALSLGEGFSPLGTLSSSSARFFFFRYAVFLPPSSPPVATPVATPATQASERA